MTTNIASGLPTVDGELLAFALGAGDDLERFKAFDLLENWQPTFPVDRVKIFMKAEPTNPEARVRVMRPGVGYLHHLDGLYVIESRTTAGAIELYKWAYGL